MEPTLTWIDLTTGDRDRMRRVLDLFREQGTVDEMGLGSLRDALADALFPGTSSLHTRLRYLLLIPWLYQRLRQRGGVDGDIVTTARNAEIELIGVLSDSEDPMGVIGSRARNQLTRLPSSVYWGALVRWGVFVPGQSQSWFHARFWSLARGGHGLAHPDDPGVLLTREPEWHPRMPKVPKGFPGNASFALSSEEAGFVQGRLEERCAGSLLAWLAREGSASPSERFWDDPDALRLTHGPGRALGDTIELARRFSLLVEGIPLLYNLLLAERRYNLQPSDGDQALIEDYRAELGDWAEREAAETPFDTRRIWDFMARRGQRVPTPQKELVDTWSDRRAVLGAAAITDDPTLRTLVELRERRLKGPQRARLVNPSRLIDWSGRAGVGRMDFRWSRVRQLLIDLHAGLGGERAVERAT